MMTLELNSSREFREPKVKKKNKKKNKDEDEDEKYSLVNFNRTLEFR